jgi:hypothetical protein
MPQFVPWPDIESFHNVRKAAEKYPHILGGIFGTVLTEARLEQGARAVAGGDLVFEKKNLGAFIGRVCKDVEKETGDELAAANLAWKEVQKAVSDAARVWFLAKL